MCHCRTLLAKRSQRHYITQCEHGTLNLVWMQTTLHLTPPLFEALAEVVHEWADDSEPDILTQQGRTVRLEPAAFEHYYLWIERTALELSVAELHILTELVQTVDCKMRQLIQSATAPHAFDAATTRPLPIIDLSPRSTLPADAGYCHELTVIAGGSIHPN
ncbi:MAG: hypothetical protein HC914_12210 [Chloroflexaceae bacterium]|nr:hypothetical protein [Chloroflexaceae bacterium]